MTRSPIPPGATIGFLGGGQLEAGDGGVEKRLTSRSSLTIAAFSNAAPKVVVFTTRRGYRPMPLPALAIFSAEHPGRRLPICEV